MNRTRVSMSIGLTLCIAACIGSNNGEKAAGTSSADERQTQGISFTLISQHDERSVTQNVEIFPCDGGDRAWFRTEALAATSMSIIGYEPDDMIVQLRGTPIPGEAWALTDPNITLEFDDTFQIGNYFNWSTNQVSEQSVSNIQRSMSEVQERCNAEERVATLVRCQKPNHSPDSPYMVAKAKLIGDRISRLYFEGNRSPLGDDNSQSPFSISLPVEQVEISPVACGLKARIDFLKEGVDLSRGCLQGNLEGIDCEVLSEQVNATSLTLFANTNPQTTSEHCSSGALVGEIGITGIPTIIYNVSDDTVCEYPEDNGVPFRYFRNANPILMVPQ